MENNNIMNVISEMVKHIEEKETKFNADAKELVLSYRNIMINKFHANSISNTAETYGQLQEAIKDYEDIAIAYGFMRGADFIREDNTKADGIPTIINDF